MNNRVIRDTADSADSHMLVTVFDGNEKPRSLFLDGFNKRIVTFGRDETNDIVLHSNIVSGEHGRFVYEKGGWFIEDKEFFGPYPSTNGLVYNGRAVIRRSLSDGDFIRIDDGVKTIAQGVLFVFSSAEENGEWKQYPVNRDGQITIGRDPSCSIVLPHVAISKIHAMISCENGSFCLYDKSDSGEIIINDTQIKGKTVLSEKDVIVLPNAKLIFTGSAIYYHIYKRGISVDAEHVVIVRGKGRKSHVTGNDISLSIKPGELVAIIGGSGAGKSTILNCMCGYLPPAQGQVFINGVDLYSNFDSLKKIIGYVPQSDIVYDDLTVHEMLDYTARLRLPKDTSKKEREEAIQRALKVVDLEEKSGSLIGSLSGGQKKRASIALELLPDPNLLFLDEPASGLDPGTERTLMLSLREMTDSGKTVILVTHSTLQLKLCDKIVFMGKGGNLCFCGSYQEAQTFFGKEDIVDVYNMITDDAVNWKDTFNLLRDREGERTSGGMPSSVSRIKTRFSLPVLCSRYAKLMLHDRKKLIILLGMGPLLALLISFVADGNQFEQCDITKSLLFALACCAYWVGAFNAIQAICKERSILKREYMTGLSLTAYVLSKVIILGVLCFVQCALTLLVFIYRVGLPEEGVFLSPAIEIFITTLLTALAAEATGLFVSAMSDNPDKAMTFAPILLMPQILFSGLIFKLDGIAEKFSYAVTCRWSVEAYGTTANLNSLPLRLQQAGFPVPHDPESFFEFTRGHLLSDWLWLAVSIIAFLVLARIILKNIRKGY